MANEYDFKIGTQAGGVGAITNLEALTVPVVPPRAYYRPDSSRINLARGVRGLGWPQAEWRWQTITRAQRDQLRTFCTGASARVYVRTRTNDSADTYKTFLAVMIWPEEEEYDATRRKSFTIRFEQMEVQA